MNKLLANTTTSLAKKAGKASLLIKKNSPELLLAAGVVGFVGTVVLACKATLRADEVLEYHKQKMKNIHDAKEIADKDPNGELEYDDKLYKQDIAVQYGRSAWKMFRLYAPTIAMGGISIACLITSRNIAHRRYLGLMAAYNSLTTAFETYRNRVKEEYGEDLDRHFRYGTTHEKITVNEIDENGKTVKKKVDTEQTVVDMIDKADIATRFFMEGNPHWDQNPNFSMMFLRGMQNTLNDRLHTKGHVFLNEVYDALGFPETPQGAVLGWIDGQGDDCIDFGLCDIHKENVRRFVNGVDNVIQLEFNYDGVIWDKI